MTNLLLLLITMILFTLGAGCAAAPAVSNLQAQVRDGQVFLTWDETPGLTGTLTVRSSAQPITAANVASARVVAHHLNPGSAQDWWLNPETFGKPVAVDPATGQKPPYPRQGFRLRPGAEPLNPVSGLHVHTVVPGEEGPRFFAVLAVSPAGEESRDLVAGQNTLAQPVQQALGAVQPIWQNPAAPDTAAGRGKPLHLILHAKTGRGGMDYLAFGDAELGWREGLPFKFGVQVKADAVEVSPTDRTWIGRMFPEGRDSCQQLTPALHSFWWGYNSHIYDPAKMAEGVATNYTERRLLWIVKWVQQTYGTDPHRTYATGGSMGGCGGIAVALRHPEIFAAVRAHVPIVAYDKGPGGDSEFRIVAECGPLDRPCSEGPTVRERLDGTRFVRQEQRDLPFVVITNGRKDGSIPWGKCPDFYRALRDRRQAFIAAWDDGEHGTCGRDLPADVKAYNDLKAFHHLALNRSYVAFSNASHDQNPGDGGAADGDIVGYMNRGLRFATPLDEADRYEVVLRCELEPAALPLTVDVTPRRLQALKLQPGQKLLAVNVAVTGGQEVQRETLTVDEQGLLTFKAFRLTCPEGNRLTLRRVP
jgi:dienelactone hydrolase